MTSLRHLYVLQFICLASLALTSVMATQPFTETFENGLGRWTNVTDNLWTATDGAAVVSLSSGPLPVPQTAILQQKEQGPFMGNYRVAGLQYIGIDFVFENAPPSEIELFLEGGPDSKSCSAKVEDFSAFMSDQTGRVWFSLASPESGGWVPNDSDSFESVLSFISRVEVRLRSASSGTYRIENIFLVGRSESQGQLTMAAGGGVDVRWVAQNQMRYQMEAAEDLTLGEAGWEPVSGVLTATGTELVVPDPGARDEPVRFYRLQLMP